jgi:hypothetical protein
MVNRDKLALLLERGWKVADATDSLHSAAEKLWVTLEKDSDVIRFDVDQEAWQLAMTELGRT